jgi:hypothetical protein
MATTPMALPPHVQGALDAFKDAALGFDFARSVGALDIDFEERFAMAVARARRAVDDFRDGRIDDGAVCARLAEPGRMLVAASRGFSAA